MAKQNDDDRDLQEQIKAAHEERVKFFRGPVTDYWIDFGGSEYPVYGKSKIYYVTNVGKKRDEILDFLYTGFKNYPIEVLDEFSIFKYIEVVLDEPEALELRAELKARFNCDLLWDGAM